MQNQINSLNTKRTLAAELRRQTAVLGENAKVTVRSLTQGCQMNRNTFYYHFSDLRELICWTLRQDLEQIRRFDSRDGHSIRLFVMDYLDDNRSFLRFAFSYLGADQFRETFVSVLHNILLEYVTLYTPEKASDEAAIQTLADAYSEMITALMVWYFRNLDTSARYSIGKVFDGVFTYAIPGLLQEAPPKYQS